MLNICLCLYSIMFHSFLSVFLFTNENSYLNINKIYITIRLSCPTYTFSTSITYLYLNLSTIHINILHNAWKELSGIHGNHEFDVYILICLFILKEHSIN